MPVAHNANGLAIPALPADLVLEHPSLASLPNPIFHRAPSDGAPIVTVQMGGASASITLPALRRQFGIDETSADGRMLTAIAESLDFVSTLRAGDPLPAEVKTGDASWTADPAHLLRASTRLRLRLVAWHHHGTLEAGPRTEALLDRLSRDPQLPHLITAALRRTQSELGMKDHDALVALVDSIAWELSFIEALRDRLLSRLQAIFGTIDAATSGLRNDRHHGDTQIQVRRLLTAAVSQIGQRFAQLDTRCADVIPILRDAQAHRAIIRANRDWLYRTQRALDPMLAQWDNAQKSIDDGFWPRMAATYRTLAPRFMSTQEWPRGNQHSAPNRR